MRVPRVNRTSGTWAGEDFSASFQERVQQVVNNLFRWTLELKLWIFRDLPKLIEAASAGPLECQCLDEQIDYVGSFNEPGFKTVPLFIFAIEVCIEGVAAIEWFR